MSRREQITREINELNSKAMTLRMELKEIDRQQAAKSVQVGDCFLSIDGRTILIVTELCANGNYCKVNSAVVKIDSEHPGYRSVHVIRGDVLLRHDVASLPRMTKDQYLYMLEQANGVMLGVLAEM